MKQFKKILFPIFWVMTIASLVSFAFQNWWWFSSLQENVMWYPQYGKLIWVCRNVFFVVFLIIVFVLLYDKKHLIKKVGVFLYQYLFFILIVVLGLALKNFHPFSSLAVYTHFPTESYLYVVEDENGKLFDHGLEYKSADIVDIYDSFLASNKLKEPLTDENKQIVGKIILKFLLERQKNKPNKCFKVIQQVNYFYNNQIKTDQIILFNGCN